MNKIDDDMQVFFEMVRVHSRNVNKFVLRAKRYPDMVTIDDEQMLMDVADGCRRIVMYVRAARGTKQR